MVIKMCEVKINEARRDLFFDHHVTLWGHFFWSYPTRVIHGNRRVWEWFRPSNSDTILGCPRVAPCHFEWHFSIQAIPHPLSSRASDTPTYFFIRKVWLQVFVSKANYNKHFHWNEPSTCERKKTLPCTEHWIESVLGHLLDASFFPRSSLSWLFLMWTCDRNE